MDSYITFAILVFTSFFTLINPLGTMPIFMSMTSSLSKQKRKNTAKKASIIAFFTIIAFAFSGQILFKFFGISVNSFRIVGGVIFFAMGWDMLQARLVSIKHTDDEDKIDAYVNDISVTPLAIPMICGPGAITNAIILMESSDTVVKKIDQTNHLNHESAYHFPILFANNRHNASSSDRLFSIFAHPHTIYTIARE